MRIMHLFFMTLLIYSSDNAYAQNKLINNVPDHSQPPQQTLPSTSNTSNYCAPFAAINIIAYWEYQRQNAYAFGATAGLQPSIAGRIYRLVYVHQWPGQLEPVKRSSYTVAGYAGDRSDEWHG